MSARRVRIAAGDVALDAVLLDTPTADAVWTAIRVTAIEG